MFHHENTQELLVKFVHTLRENADLLREVQEEGYPPQKKHSLFKNFSHLFQEDSDSDDSDTEEKIHPELQKKISLFLETIHTKTSDHSPKHVIQIILDRLEHFVKAGGDLNDKIAIKEKNGKLELKTITYILLMQFSHFSFAEKILKLGGNPNILNSDGTSLFDPPPRGRFVFMEIVLSHHLNLLV